MTSAKLSGQIANVAQLEFRKEKNNLKDANNKGDIPAGRTAANNMFKQAGKTVISRNNELKNLSAFTVTSDVSTPKDGAVFWSGNTRDASGNVQYSAMETAHSFASASGRRAVEQTPGGSALENYAGHPKSFGFLAKRFEYTAETDREGAQSAREGLLKTGAEKTGVSIRDAMGPELYDGLTTTDSKGKEYGPAGRPFSAAGAMWDTMSVRYARKAEGEVNVIHAAPADDPYFKSAAFKKSTWHTKEQPTLKSEGKTTIKESYAEDLQGKLKGPIDTVPEYENTGGFKGNLPK
jgi:hypothetical protein